MNDSVRIQFVDQAPTNEIAALYYEAEWLSSDDDSSFIPKMVAGSFCFAVARNDEQIVGMARALSDGCSDAYIQDVVVLKRFRGTGIGKRLVDAVRSKLETCGIDWIGLIARPNTKQFYKPLGFDELQSFTPMKYNND